MGFRVLALAIVLACGVAHADAPKPWAVGVSEDRQAKALEKFQQGNELFVKDEWRAALKLYLEALVYWDHPNIRYNAAVCLYKLDRKVEAYEHMTAAMKYGEAPLGKDLFAKGTSYMEDLKAAVSHVQVVCESPAAMKVTLDGEVLDKCPDTRLVAAGKHLVIAEKSGYKTETRELVAPAGGTASVPLTLQLEGTRKLTRRWARWKPWSVVGIGTAFSVAAVPLFVITRDKFDRYESDLADHCATFNGTSGCAPNDPEVAKFDGQLSNAKLYRTLTISSIAIGATGIGVGIVLIVMNQPRYGAKIAPMPGADRGGVTITTDW